MIAFAALLMACFRQSKRRAAQFLSLILNQPASTGWMVQLQERAADAVQPAYDELAKQLPTQAILNIDESPTKQANAKAWVWTIVAKRFTLFACRTSRGAGVLQELLGESFGGVIHCDRAKMYWRFGRLQWCWAHLKRDFQAWIDSPCPAKRRQGRDLMKPTRDLFALWMKVRNGSSSRRAFPQRIQPIRERIHHLLLRGYFNSKTVGLCAELADHERRLWHFVDMADVEPTNNAAERALRHAVIWRKLSFGTQSAAASSNGCSRSSKPATANNSTPTPGSRKPYNNTTPDSKARRSSRPPRERLPAVNPSDKPTDKSKSEPKVKQPLAMDYPVGTILKPGIENNAGRLDASINW